MVEGVGDDPGCSGHGYRDGIAGPREVIVGCGEEPGNPDEEFKADDHGGEQAGGETGEDAGEDGGGGQEEADGGSDGPEHLSGGNPGRDPGGYAFEVNDVIDGKGDGADAIEAADDGSAPRPGRAGRREGGEEDEARDDQRRLLKEIAP